MDYTKIFEGKEFEAAGGTWTAHVTNEPGVSAQGTDRLCFMLAFTKENSVDHLRLKLWASRAGINGANHIPKLHDYVRLWLEDDNRGDELECFDLPQ